MEEKKKRGGARPGSGRKARGRAASSPLMIYLPEDDRTKLDEAVERTGETKTTFVREAIRDRIALKSK